MYTIFNIIIKVLPDDQISEFIGTETIQSNRVKFTNRAQQQQILHLSKSKLRNENLNLQKIQAEVLYVHIVKFFSAAKQQRGV